MAQSRVMTTAVPHEERVKDDMFESCRRIYKAKNDQADFPISFHYDGRTFVALKDVFFAEGHDMFAKELPATQNGDFLEIGTGTGCVAAAYFLRHPHTRRLLVTDINPEAIATAQINFKSHQVQGELLLSDLFKNIPSDEKFDVIFWNVPFYINHVDTMTWLDKAIVDPGYITIERFIVEAPRFLKDGGRAFLGFSSQCGDLETLRQIAVRHGRRISIFCEDERDTDNFESIKFELLQLH